MSHNEKLYNFKTYAEEIIQKVQDYRNAIQEFSTQENEVSLKLHKCIETIETIANEVVESASSSVKIGVMGEFSSGKTTLLGSLLGYAGLLPDSEGAATGNVTYLRIEQEKSLQKTQFAFKVEYLNQSDVEACLNFMLKTAKDIVSTPELSEELVTELKNLDPQNIEIWQQVVSWCKESQEYIGETDTELNNLIKEIKLFTQSYIWYGKDVCSTVDSVKNPVQVDIDTVHFALRLENNFINNQNEKINFNSISSTEKEKSGDFLQATFPLIHKIDVEVKVSEAIWNLSSIQGANKLVLLDFPGLGNKGSSVRDKFLSQREIENVQTILILTYGPRPGSDNTSEIFSMLKQQPNISKDESKNELILVGVGRFDEINFVQATLDELIQQEEPLTEETILSKLGVLDKAIQSVQNYTKHPDRIIFLSGFIALNKMKNRFSPVEIASPEVLKKLNDPAFQEKSQQLGHKWEQLSLRLKESNSNSTLASLLEEVSKNGGINQLRVLLEQHVTDHGLRQIYEQTHDKVKKLCEQQKQLKKMLDSPSLQNLLASEKSNLRTLRLIIKKLAHNYKTLKNYLVTSPLEFGLGIEKNRDRTPLVEVVKDEVIAEIEAWKEWRYLIDNLNNGKIRIPKSQDQQAKTNYASRWKNKDQPIDIPNLPKKSDDFFNTFENTVKKMEQDTRHRITEAIIDFLNELSNSQVLLPLLENNETIDFSSLRSELKKLLPVSKILNDYPILSDSINPIDCKDILIENSIDKSEELQQTLIPENIFPLAREENNKPGQKFSWALEESNENIKSENHQILMYQIKNAMINSLSQQLINIVRLANQEFNHELTNNFLVEIIKELESISQNRSDLNKILNDESQTNNSTPDWLESLKDISSAQYPL